MRFELDVFFSFVFYCEIRTPVDAGGVCLDPPAEQRLAQANTRRKLKLTGGDLLTFTSSASASTNPLLRQVQGQAGGPGGGGDVGKPWHSLGNTSRASPYRKWNHQLRLLQLRSCVC